MDLITLAILGIGSWVILMLIAMIIIMCIIRFACKCIKNMKDD